MIDCSLLCDLINKLQEAASILYASLETNKKQEATSIRILSNSLVNFSHVCCCKKMAKYFPIVISGGEGN